MTENKYSAPLTPILLISFGRTGTTLVMQLLGSSNHIIFDKNYPYENRLISYFYRLLSLPFQQKPEDMEWNNENLLYSTVNKMGPLPLQTDLIQDHQGFRNDAFMRLWNAFSIETRKQHKEAAYYAEKIPLDIPPELNKVLPCKNLFLLRDPRDEMVSIMNFNRKRGILSFGWEPDDTPVSFAKRLAKQRKAFLNHLINLKQDNRRMLLIYEDLVSNMELESRQISDWLGVEIDPAIVKNQKTQHVHHMTSSSPEESIQRWKKELDIEVLDVFNNEIGSELQALGYET